LSQDPAVATGGGSANECVSAIARLERESLLTYEDAAAALARLRVWNVTWTEVPATPPVKEQAMRLLRLHPLRAADALQLAAAIVAADFQPGTLEFVTLDSRQSVAAEREGFVVIGPA
jgi:predicted nucleic acid-binding protein